MYKPSRDTSLIMDIYLNNYTNIVDADGLVIFRTVCSCSTRHTAGSRLNRFDLSSKTAPTIGLPTAMGWE